MEDNNTKSEYDLFWKKQKEALLTSYINTIFIFLNILAFIITLFLGNYIYVRGALVYEYVVDYGEYYRIISSMFIHGGLQHILGNMLSLVFIGSIIESHIGHLSYLALYMGSGIAGNIVSLWYEHASGTSWISYGASGAVFGIIGAFIIIAIRGKNTLRKGSTLLIRTGLFTVYSVYSSFADEGVNYAAHIGGLIFGVLFTTIIIVLSNKKINLEEWI